MQEISKDEIERYTKELGEDKENVDLLLLRANSYIAANQYDSALNDIEKAAKLRVNNYQIYLKWGIALFHKGKLQEALEKFKIAKVLGSTEESFKESKCEEAESWILKCSKEFPSAQTDEIPDLDYYVDSKEYETHKKLLSFGYYYNQFGQLRSIQSKSKYKFTNQKDYDDLCTVVIEFIQELLKKHYNAIEQWLPLPEDNKGEKGSNNIFLSPDFETNTKKCVICIQGSGEVRAGQWARYCCMNDTLDTGTVFSLIERAKEEGYSYIILNPNLNKDPITKERIKANETSEDHCLYVWNKFIRKSPAKELYVIAHSAGGACTSSLLFNNPQEFLMRVQMVALCDTCMLPGANEEQKKFLRNVSSHN